MAYPENAGSQQERERVKAIEWPTQEELKELRRQAQELDRRSTETDKRVERVIADLDRLERRIRESA